MSTPRDPLRLVEPGAGAPEFVRSALEAGVSDLPSADRLARIASRLPSGPAGSGPAAPKGAVPAAPLPSVLASALYGAVVGLAVVGVSWLAQPQLARPAPSAVDAASAAPPVSITREPRAPETNAPAAATLPTAAPIATAVA